MENIKSYIESGILELYVLGDLSMQEMAEVEQMAQLHPEIKAELAEIEKAMNNIANSLTVKPDLKVKAGFFNSISFSDEEEVGAAKAESNEGAKVIMMNSRKLNFYKFSLAACLALLLVSILAIINLNNNLKASKQQIAELQNSNQNFANKVNYLDQRVSSSEQALNVLSNPDYKMVKLNGTPNSPNSKLVIAFNAKEKKVILDLHNMDMPTNDEAHQYQLWALVDGKPVDLGLFDASDSKNAFVKDMKSIGVAQAFAVTLEPRGGSVNPTLDKMMVMGAI
ncbi:MAG: anti-sigma factor [Sphingobacteriales bacterium]|nr:anti-sigma factor [Sphingobacteriales bacterium]